MKLDGRTGFFYILAEHQSTPCWIMALRLWHYVCHIWLRHMENFKSNTHEKLPIIYPLIFYHGKTSPYPYPLDLFDLFDDIDLAKQIYLKPFQVIDLTTTDVSDIKNHGNAAIMEMLQKHVFVRDMKRIVKEMIESGLFHNKLLLSDDSYFGRVIEYLLESSAYKNTSNDLFKLLEASLPNGREKMISYADHFRSEGAEQGLEQGIEQGLEQGKIDAKIEIAKKLLLKGQPIDFIRETTGLTEQQIRQLLVH